MASQSGHIVFHLLVANKRLRDYLFDLLRVNGHHPLVRAGLDDLLEALKSAPDAIVFLDTEAVAIFGPSIYSKIKAALPGKRIILLCDQSHRQLIEEAMQHGSYGCILEPYAEWEVLTIVKHILSDIQPIRRRAARGKRKSKKS